MCDSNEPLSTLCCEEEETPPDNKIWSMVDNDIPFDINEWSLIDSASGRRRSPLILEFLRLLLGNPKYASYASYIDEYRQTFYIHKPKEIAALWQQVKSRQSNRDMSYDKFARAIRWYYKRQIMIKTNSKYMFQFGMAAAEIDESNIYVDS